MAEGNFSRARIEAYLGRKFTKEEITISNAGKPDSLNYISYWSNNVEKPKPTEAQLIALESEGNKIINNMKAVTNRQKEYGTVEKQIEFITEKGLEAWLTKVQEIITKYPKESS